MVKLLILLEALIALLHDLTLYCDQVSDVEIHVLQESLLYDARICIDLIRNSGDSKQEVHRRAYFLRHQLMRLRFVFSSSFNDSNLVKMKSIYRIAITQIKSE